MLLLSGLGAAFAAMLLLVGSVVVGAEERRRVYRLSLIHI